MHIYDLLLNKNFLNNITNATINMSLENFDKSRNELLLNNFEEYMLPILNSLKNENNIFIEVDLNNKIKNPTKFIKFFSKKEFFKNNKYMSIELNIIPEKSSNNKVLILNYKMNKKSEEGYLLHFGENIFVIIKNIDSPISKQFAAIPIEDYYTNFMIKTSDKKYKEKELKSLVNTVIDIFNNQILENQEYHVQTIYTNDNREFSINSGKFDVAIDKDYMKYQYTCTNDNDCCLYDFICLTDGEISTGDFNLSNYFTIGILTKKQTNTSSLNSFKSNSPIKKTFNLENLNIYKINKLEEFVKLLGFIYIARNTFINPILAQNNLIEMNKLIQSLSEVDITANYGVTDFESINTFVEQNFVNNNILEFKYKDKVLFSSLGLDKKTASTIPYNTLKTFILTLIDERFLQSINSNSCNMLSESYISLEDAFLNKKVKFIVDYIKSGKECYIANNNNLTKSKIDFHPNDYIYYVEQNNELVLINSKQIYTIFIINDNMIVLNLLDNASANPNTKREIVYKTFINPDYLKIKNFLDKF